MPVPDKDVTITTDNLTITIVVEFSSSPGYLPTVTVTPAGGIPVPLTGTRNGNKFEFTHTAQQTGDHTVEVKCSDKEFGDTVDVQAATSTAVAFKYKKVK